MSTFRILLLAALLTGTNLPAKEPATTSAAVASAQWEKEIAAFEAADRLKPPPKGCIVFVGSSSIRLWKTLAADFPGYPVINRGFGGSMMADSAYFAERIVTPYEPRLVVVYAGSNDLNAHKTPQQVAADFQAFTKTVRAHLPQTRIAYISIAGNPSRWAQVEKVKAANALIEEFVKTSSNMRFINVFPKMLGADGLPLPDIFQKDNLHMNPAGYKIWTETVLPFLAE